MGYMLAPTPANVNFIACKLLCYSFKGADGAPLGISSDATTAVIAHCWIDVHDFVIVPGDTTHGACLLNGAFLATIALFFIHRHRALADDAKVVEVGLDAVVGTTTYGDFKLMGK